MFRSFSSFCIFIIVLLVFSLSSVVNAEKKNCRMILDELAKKHVGRFDTVVAKFKKEALEGTNPARAFYILGIAHDIKGLTNQARNYYQRSLDIMPDGNPARKFLDHLDGNMEACSVSEKKSTPLVDASIISGVSPEELVDRYSRYKGETVGLKGWILAPVERKRGKYEILCSTLPSTRGGGGRMDGYFLIRSSQKIEKDKRIERGGKITVRGDVSDRDFLKNPTTREMSTNRKVIIDPEAFRVVNEGVLSGPLTVRLK